MTSKEEDDELEGMDEFDRIVEEQQLSTTPLKALLWHNSGALAVTGIALVLAVVRSFLAIYGLWAFHDWTVTIVVLALYGLYWARPLFLVVRTVRKGRKEASKANRIKPEDASFEEVQEAFDNLEKIGKPEKPDPRPKFWHVFSPLGMSILAGIGVAHLVSPPLGIIAALIFFAVALSTLYGLVRRFRQFARSVVQMRPDRPRNTPET